MFAQEAGCGNSCEAAENMKGVILRMRGERLNSSEVCERCEFAKDAKDEALTKKQNVRCLCTENRKHHII